MLKKIIVGFCGHLVDSTTATWRHILSSIVFFVLETLATVGGIHYVRDTLRWSCWLENVTKAFQNLQQLQAE